MHSQLLLLPDQHLGVFVAYNSWGSGGRPTLQHAGFQKAFFDHYFTTPAVALTAPPADFAGRAGRFVGSYRFSSSPATTLIKVVELFGAYRVGIRDPADGTLLFAIEGQEWRFAEVEPLFFRQVDGPFRMIFREDGNGRITEMFTDLMPQYAAMKLDWYDDPAFNMALAMGSVLIFLSAIPVALAQLIRPRRKDGLRGPMPRAARAACWIILGISVANLAFVAGAIGFVQWGMVSELHPVSSFAKTVLGVGSIAAVLTIGALIFTVLAWKHGYWGIAMRAFYTVATGASLAFVWFLNYWNLLGWRY